MEHTRGKWEVSTDGSKTYIKANDPTLEANDNYAIARCFGHDAKANALLIANAPKMKAQLQHSHTIMSCLRTSLTTVCECKSNTKQPCNRCAIDNECDNIESLINDIEAKL